MFVLLAGMALPIAIQYGKATTNGLVWQGRYGLPLLVGIPILCARSLEDRGRLDGQPRRRLIGAIATLIVVGNVGGYYWAMHRWTVGLSRDSWYFDNPIWHPPLPVPLWVQFIAFVVAVSVPTVLCWRWSNAPPIDADSTLPELEAVA